MWKRGVGQRGLGQDDQKADELGGWAQLRVQPTCSLDAVPHHGGALSDEHAEEEICARLLHQAALGLAGQRAAHLWRG